MSINKIGKEECKVIRATVNEALAAALEELGVKASIGNMTYTGDTVSFKTTVSVDGYNADETEFKKGCWKYDLKPADYGRKFENNGEVFTICGLKPRSRKYPIIGRRADGKKFKFPARVVAKQLADM